MELETLAGSLIRAGGDKPAFEGYTPEGARRPYPAALCVSINEEVVHGIPNESPRTLKEGDIVALDLGLIHDGIVVDSAITVAVGKVSKEAQELMNATQSALEAAIAAAVAGAVAASARWTPHASALRMTESAREGLLRLA